MSVLAYTLRSSANFDKSGVSLEGYDGNVYITYSQTEYLRVSDLASLRSELDMYIRFVPYGISSLTQILGDITITTSYSPVSETYDFPLRLDEQWTTTTTSFAQWSGSSDYITPFPPPVSDTNSTTWEVASVGKPSNAYGQTIGYGGCNASYELQSVNSDGVQMATGGIAPKFRIMRGSTQKMTLALPLTSGSNATFRLGRVELMNTAILEHETDASMWTSKIQLPL